MRGPLSAGCTPQRSPFATPMRPPRGSWRCAKDVTGAGLPPNLGTVAAAESERHSCVTRLALVAEVADLGGGRDNIEPLPFADFL